MKKHKKENMLEKIDNFFDNRVDKYDKEHMRLIAFSEEIYRTTATALPKEEYCEILDLGCGTGLELEYYLPLNPTARITGIDIAPGMLNRLNKKFQNSNITLILGSYFDIPFDSYKYDAVLSVESLHHFKPEEKIPLYKKTKQSLKENGYFLLTDYFSQSDEEERQHQEEFLNVKKEEGICSSEIYHFDIPLTIQHELSCLKSAGFSRMKILHQWLQTAIIKAW